MSGRRQVWKPNFEDFPRSESLSFGLYSFTYLHSHQQVPEARMASGFPYRGKQEGSTKTSRDPSNTVGGRSVGVFTSKRSSEPAEIAEPVTGRAEGTRSHAETGK